MPCLCGLPGSTVVGHCVVHNAGQMEFCPIQPGFSDVVLSNDDVRNGNSIYCSSLSDAGDAE